MNTNEESFARFLLVRRVSIGVYSWFTTSPPAFVAIAGISVGSIE